MKGILLDTNHVSARIAERPSFMDRLNRRPVDRSPLRVCAITLAELELADLITTTSDPEKRKLHRAFVIEWLHPWALEITRHTATNYSQIMARIKAKHPHPNSHTQRGLADLGVDIHDAWITASAWEHNLILLTTDTMALIREVVKDDVEFDNWCV